MRKIDILYISKLGLDPLEYPESFWEPESYKIIHTLLNNYSPELFSLHEVISDEDMLDLLNESVNGDVLQRKLLKLSSATIIIILIDEHFVENPFALELFLALLFANHSKTNQRILPILIGMFSLPREFAKFEIELFRSDKDMNKGNDIIFTYIQEEVMETITKAPSVFVSYNWEQMEFADKIELKLDGIATVARDNKVPHWGSLIEFMKTIRQQDFAILLISDEYLKSTNCMFEVSQLVKDDNWIEKVMFVVFSNAKIYDTSEHGQYIDYWQRKRQGIEKQIDSLPKQSVDGLIAELRKIDEIQIVISTFLTKIKESKNPQLDEATMAIIKRISRYTFDDCQNIRTLFLRGIDILSKTTDTNYNQIILSARTASHNIGLVVFADKILDGKHKYRVVEQGGLIANCFAAGKKIISNDVINNEDYFSAVLETASEAVIPISFKGRTLGVFNSESELLNYFRDDKIVEIESILVSFTRQLINLGYKTNTNFNELPYISI